MTLSKFIKIGSIIGIILAILASFWWVLHGDLYFSSDIARDFLLFGEIQQKGFILIGPKSSVAGLFHGPLWLYINYPAYILGGGNPLVLGYFWIFLIILFVGSCYYVGRELFNKETGWLFALMTATYMFFHVSQFFNPVGAMMIIPFCFYLIVRYLETYKLKFLIPYIILLGFMVQFQLAIGIPFYILSVALLIYKLIKTKQRWHLAALLLIAFPLLNFLIFDLRHDFLLTNGVLRYLSPESGDSVKYNYLYMLFDRTKLAIINVELLRSDPYYRNAVLGLIFIFFLLTQIRNNKYRQTYFLFIYFYLGYFVTTLINKGPILYFYFYPLFPLTYLIFSSFITNKYKYIFLFIFICVYLLNLFQVLTDISYSKNYTGRDETSWKFLHTMSEKVFDAPEKEFGYFVYTPDVIGYAPKYALTYQQKLEKEKVGAYFTKKSTTYIIVAPAAANNPFLSYTWWRENRLMITSSPSATFTFPNGYSIEKYNLSDSEVNTPHHPGIDPGLGFR